MSRLSLEAGQATGIEESLLDNSAGEELLAGGIEVTVQHGEEVQRLGGDNLGIVAWSTAVSVHSTRSLERHKTRRIFFPTPIRRQ